MSECYKLKKKKKEKSRNEERGERENARGRTGERMRQGAEVIDQEGKQPGAKGHIPVFSIRPHCSAARKWFPQAPGSFELLTTI